MSENNKVLQAIDHNNDIYVNNLNDRTKVTREQQALFLYDDSVHPAKWDATNKKPICDCECFSDYHEPHPGIDYPKDGGIFVYLKGLNGVKVLYPSKGLPDPQFVAAINIPKRYLISELKFFASVKPLAILFTLLPYKHKIDMIRKWLYGFGFFCKISLMGRMLQEKRYMKSTKAIRIFVRTFLNEIGVNDTVVEEDSTFDNAGDRFAVFFSHIIEMDTAYRLRIQDIMSETSKKLLLEDPAGEVERLLRLFIQREPKKHITVKFKSVAFLLSLLLKTKRMKAAFIKAVEATPIEDIQMDRADYYHCLKFGGYAFFGRTLEDRDEEYKALHNGLPPTMAIYTE